MWLAGWAARREPASGKAMDLFAKALALEDAQGGRVVIITADLIALPRALTDAVAARVRPVCGLTRDRLLFNASHTHTGPEIRPDKVPFFEIPTEFAAKIPPYVARLEEQLAALIEEAIDRLAPVTLRVHVGRATFGANRRASGGPSDPSVPVLEVRDTDDNVRAIVFGYACHNLVLPPSFCAYHGDYAGIAQRELERAFPAAAALFLAGAGADQDPAPRGTPDLAKAHGVALAHEVCRVCASGGRAIQPRLAVQLTDIVLDLQPLPAIGDLETDVRSTDAPRRRKAEFLLRALAEKRPLPVTQSCPVHVLRLGGELLFIALGGEPVVDFALRFHEEFAGPVVWVAGYSNDMFGYLPTRRVQEEGGYEGGRATLWSALPMPIAADSEDRVVEAVRRLVHATV